MWERQKTRRPLSSVKKKGMQFGKTKQEEIHDSCKEYEIAHDVINKYEVETRERWKYLVG